MSVQDYFNQVYSDARDFGCNHIQASLCATQSSMETGWGKHIKGNSYFGIKAGSSWEGETISFTTHEFINGKNVKIVDEFRKYDNKSDSIRDYAATMEAKWPDAWAAATYEDAARGLLTGVYGAYATDPSYVQGVSATSRKRGPIAQAAYEGLLEVPKPLPEPKANIAAKGRPQQSADITREVIKQHLHLIPAEHQGDATVLLGVRGYFLDSKGKVGENDRGVFDDALFVVSPRGVWSFNANVDPSIYKHRRASYKANQAVSFKQGIHGWSKPPNRRYKAFEQVSVADVHRDNFGPDRGDFHMNIHRGSSSGGTSSAGCITVPYGEQWDQFFERACEEMDQDAQDLIWLILLEYQGGVPPIVEPEDDDEETIEWASVPTGLDPVAQQPVAAGPVASSPVHTLISGLTENVEGNSTMAGSDGENQNNAPLASLLSILALQALAGDKSNKESLASNDALKAVLRAIVEAKTGSTLQNGGTGDVLTKMVLDALSRNEETTETPEEKLGPVNGALGGAIGRLLNGRKTAIGLVGSIVSQVFGSADQGSALSNFVEQSIPLLSGQSGIFLPLFIGMTIWGGLGKFEKWNQGSSH